MSALCRSSWRCLPGLFPGEIDSDNDIAGCSRQVIEAGSDDRRGVLTPRCPLICLAYELPAKPFNALTRYLRWPRGGHPAVGHVARMHQQQSLTGIRGLGVAGIENIRRVLVRAGPTAEPEPELAGWVTNRARAALVLDQRFSAPIQTDAIFGRGGFR